MTEKKPARKRPSKAAKAKQGSQGSGKAAKAGARKDAHVAPQESDGLAIPRHDPYEGRIYTTSLWKGMPNYECKFCAMATLDHDDALKHFRMEHVPAEREARTIDTGLVSEDGSKITRVEPAKEE